MPWRFACLGLGLESESLSTDLEGSSLGFGLVGLGLDYNTVTCLS